MIAAWSRAFLGQPWSAIALALGLGSIGAVCFFQLGLPLAPLLGAMWANTIAALLGARVHVPNAARNVMIMILGVFLGSAFTPDLAANLMRWSLTLSGLGVYVAIGTAAGAAYLRYAVKRDPVTSYFTAVPGGLSEMILTGTKMGGDERFIALSHVLRIMLVVLGVALWFKFFAGYDRVGGNLPGPPWSTLSSTDLGLLAACSVGWPLASWLRLPTPMLLGPLIVSAAIHLGGLTGSRPPRELIVGAQVVLGSAVGCRFVGANWIYFLRTVRSAFGLAGIMLTLTFATALIFQAFTGYDFAPLVLAFAPGGLAEMSLVALALGEDPAFVATHQVIRIIVILMLASNIFRWFVAPRLKQPPDDAD